MIIRGGLLRTFNIFNFKLWNPALMVHLNYQADARSSAW
jgi:hypothetical protein